MENRQSLMIISRRFTSYKDSLNFIQNIKLEYWKQSRFWYLKLGCQSVKLEFWNQGYKNFRDLESIWCQKKILNFWNEYFKNLWNHKFLEEKKMIENIKQ